MFNKSQWIPFTSDKAEYAAELLMNSRNKAFHRVAAPECFAEADCIGMIQAELARDVSSSLMLMDGDNLAGFAIATVSDDPIWGRSGWLNPGAFALKPGYSRALPELYARIGHDWLERGILEHKIFALETGDDSTGIWADLGFAGQQAHAVLDLSVEQDFQQHNSVPHLVIRRAEKGDTREIAGFSRLIASFQAGGPCFAPAPDAYLQSLDSGFAELLDDEEAEILVADLDGHLVGISVCYAASEPELLFPRGCTELAVAAVKPEFRGTGVGTRLTQATFADQKNRGRTFMITDWRCANPLSSRFWPSVGFVPVAHRLLRRLNPLHLQ